MGGEINLDSQLREFHTQQYPNPQETITNNASTLYKRKKFFLSDLRHSIKFIGFVMIILVYLRDLSMVQMATRGFSHYTLSNPYPSTHLYTDESKKGLAKFLLIKIFFINGFCIFMHLVFGVPTETVAEGDHYLYGGMTVEFIGERIPTGRLELLVYDVLILGCQMVLHNLMCFTSDSEILSVKPEQNVPDDLMAKPYNYLDGYNGNVVLLNIDIVKSVKTVMSYENLGLYDPEAVREGGINYRFPGGFHQGN